MDVLIDFILGLLSLAVVATTVAPLSSATQWWIRMWDFPRVHIAVIGLVLILLTLPYFPGPFYVVPILLALCVAYQLRRIWPFTRFAPTEIAMKDVPEGESRIRIIASNVLMENEEYDKVRQMVRENKPDLLLLMETDKTWDAELSDLLDEFDVVLREPLDNYYGMIFASRLPVAHSEFKYLQNEMTPTLLAYVTPEGGKSFNFIGMHPRPPVPGDDTDARDAIMEKTAKITHNQERPTVAMGDFNDVAWSYTSRKFKQYGQYRDPRIGRGFLSSFHAQKVWMQFPIDQIYLTEGVALENFRTGPDVGSDHYPMIADIWVER